MDTKNNTLEDIKDLQENVVFMRTQCWKEIEKNIKKIDALKVDILEGKNYTTDYESVDVPSFPFEKYERLIGKDISEKLKTRKQLKEDIIVLRTLLEKRTCPIEKLLRE